MLDITNYPLTQEGHNKLLKEYVTGLRTASHNGLFNRVVDYHYELMFAREKLKRLEEERDMLLQRVECLRPKHPACKCGAHE